MSSSASSTSSSPRDSGSPKFPTNLLENLMLVIWEPEPCKSEGSWPEVLSDRRLIIKRLMKTGIFGC